MKSYFVILVASIVIAVQSIAPAEARYNRINEYLISHVIEYDAIEPNMKALSTWLREKEAQKQPLLSTTPISDLRQLTALQQVLEDTKCDHTAYEIMRPIEKALDLHKMNEHNRVIRRIDKVILKIFREHADRCMKAYPAAYEAARNQLDKAIFERVAKIGETFMVYERFAAQNRPVSPQMNSKDLFNKYIKYSLSLGEIGGQHVLRGVLKSCAENDPDVRFVGKVPDELSGKRVVHKDKIKELTRKYMIEPCRQYVDVMAPDVFIPAGFDARVYVLVGDQRDYYLGWSYYRICKLLIDDESELVYDIVRSI